jgi:hypothetical protein
LQWPPEDDTSLTIPSGSGQLLGCPAEAEFGGYRRDRLKLAR